MIQRKKPYYEFRHGHWTVHLYDNRLNWFPNVIHA